MMVHPDSHKVSRAPWYSGYSRALQISHTGLSPSLAGLSRPFRYPSESHIEVPQPRKELLPAGLAYSPFARRYLGSLN